MENPNKPNPQQDPNQKNKPLNPGDDIIAGGQENKNSRDFEGKHRRDSEEGHEMQGEQHQDQKNKKSQEDSRKKNPNDEWKQV